jgi:hypothetical protein
LASWLWLGAAACGGGAAEIAAGKGLLVAPEGAMAIDPAVVPLPRLCNEHQVVARSPGGYRCVGAAEPWLAGGRPSAATLRALEARVASLEARAAAFPCGLRGTASQPEVELAASSCVVSAIDGDTQRSWWLLGPTLKIRPGQRGRAKVTCPIVPRCGEWDGTWNTLTVYYGDPDGDQPEHQLTATLLAGDAILAVLRSSDLPAVEHGTMSVALGGVVPDPELARRRPSHYRLEIELFDDAPAAEIQFRGARID